MRTENKTNGNPIPACAIRLRRLIPATVVFCTALFCAATLRADEYSAVAQEIGDHLIESARHDGDALYWQQYEGGPPNAGEEDRQLPVSLYNGVSGTGLFLLNLYNVTGDKKYLSAARGAGIRLVNLAKQAESGGLKWNAKSERKGRIIPDSDGCGLYSGNAGIGLFLMNLHKVCGEDRFKKCAEGAFERILKDAKQEKGGLCWEYAMQDIIGGEAGIGLALLEMHRLTGRKEYLDAANKTGNWLMAVADRKNGRCEWAKYGYLDANFSHGTAGIAFFLASLKDPEAQKAAAGATDWIESVAKPDGKNGIFWEYYAETVPEGQENRVMTSWCHGSPGTALLFVRQSLLKGKERHLEVVKKAGEGLKNDLRVDSGEPAFANPTFCCGAAGCIDAFCNIYEATKDKKYLDCAKAVADAVIKSLERIGKNRVYAMFDTEDMQNRKFPYFPTGFMLGNAGIGHSLLRLSALISGKPEKLVLLPDQPFCGTTEK
jgi:lantibiotic modifying enzyme